MSPASTSSGWGDGGIPNFYLIFLKKKKKNGGKWLFAFWRFVISNRN
jgi:hypothetical protein